MAGIINPRIVSNGLVFYVDAANSLSYTPGSATWRDLTEYGNNGTLNGPGFSNANAGSITFDGVNDSVDCGNGASIQIVKDISIVAWINPANFTVINQIAGKTHPTTAYPTPYSYLINIHTGIPIFASGGSVSYWEVPGSNSVIANSWQQVAVTMNSGSGASGYNAVTHYLNQNLNGTDTSYSIPINEANNLIIGNRSNGNGPFTGSIAMVAIYNRTLSAAEVRQNYNALKARFRLP